MATLTEIEFDFDQAARGAQTLIERSAPAGAMPPLHSRGEGETYRVLEGDMTFFVDSEVVHAEPGDVIVAPAGSARTYRAGSDGARWLVLTRVASVERFVDFGRAVARPLPTSMAGWPSADEQAAVAAIGAANGIELLGPPGDLP
jgi:mannose-6-phosphate isomerase-like protein (cupin superfamily)